MNDDSMDKLKLTFKHLVIDLMDKEKATDYKVSVADIASLMESLQSSLLQYWEYDPALKHEEGDAAVSSKKKKAKKQSTMRLIDPTIERDEDEEERQAKAEEEEDEPEEQKKTFKKRPLVFFMDEAHKLPALVEDQLSLKVFLDTLLVLTKQDRLCHVILSTSDSFFQHFLRTMNVGHHAQIVTIGDCTKEETYAFFMDNLIEKVPADLRPKVDFEGIYDVFGGKLSHITDYLSAWVNADGDLTPYTSAIFIQAYTLLQIHLHHDGFETFSPLSTATAGTTNDDKSVFSRDDLLFVMRKLVEPPYSLPYFDLCRQIGTSHADGMIKTRVLDLRWTRSVSPEQEWIEREWSADGVERPIVLPMTRVVRKAMEVVLRESDTFEQRNPGLAAKQLDDAAKKQQPEETLKEPESVKETITDALDTLYKRMPDSIWKESPFKRG